jgi:hypothetical protein
VRELALVTLTAKARRHKILTHSHRPLIVEKSPRGACWPNGSHTTTLLLPHMHLCVLLLLLLDSCH